MVRSNAISVMANATTFTVIVNVKTSGGANIQGATVTIDGGSSMSTDSSGNVTFSGVASGSHAFAATASGFNPASTTQNVTGNATYNLVLAPIANISALMIAAQDTSGAAINGLFVSISPADTTGKTSAFTPAGFSLTNNTAYQVQPTNSFNQYTFSHWLDNNSTTSLRTVNIAAATTLTAVYSAMGTVTSVTLMATTATTITAGGMVSFSGVVSGASGGISGVQLFTFQNNVLVSGTGPVSGAGGAYTFSLTFPLAGTFTIFTSTNNAGT